MNSFVNSVGNMTTTTNGMPAYKVTKSLTDLFFGIGAARNNPGIVDQFIDVFKDSPLLALKCLFWVRDVRGGAGERKVFRDIMGALETHSPDIVVKNIHLVPEYGRFDDLLVFSTPAVREAAMKVFAEAITSGNGLAAKWAPREKSAKKKDAFDLMRVLGMSSKQYRKTIAAMTKVVETNMCAKDWTGIEYDHVPSVASARYQAAFGRNDPTGYTKFKESLKSGTTKINASSIFPHDVIRGGKSGDWDVADAQWKALPNYMNDKKILPISDVSGSMCCPASGSVTCMDVSVALGLYCSEKNTGPFKDLIVTFSSTPTLERMTGRLEDRVSQCSDMPWGGSTDFAATFDLILRHAINNNVPAKDMPEVLICFSDMQFDEADDSNSGFTAVKMAKNKFNQYGYKTPLLVFWNLNGSYGNKPSSNQEDGVVLVSGFSPAIMKSVLACDFDNITPEAMVLSVLNSDRYAAVTI